jgi:uncharacterized protein
VSTVRASVKKQPVLTYCILAFVISWGCLLLAIGGPRGIPVITEQFEVLLPLVVLALLAGPTGASILLTGFVSGRAGYRELLSRLLRWRVRIRWYVAALLIAPLLMTVIPLALSLLFPAFLPGILTKDDKASVLVVGVAAGLMAGIFEELGWTGFAIPRLRLRFGVLTTGLIVGFLWAAWHFLVNFWSSGSPSGTLSLSLLLTSLIFSLGILPAYRILMVWAYDRSGSLLVAMLMHLSLTASNVIFGPPSMAGATGPAWSTALAAGFWIVVAAVARANGGQLSRQPVQKRAT